MRRSEGVFWEKPFKLTIIAFLLLVPAGWQAVFGAIYVKQGGSGNGSSWGDAYGSLQSKNPIYASGGSYRVSRGGGWASRPGAVRCALRNYGAPVCRNDTIGVRLVRTR